jgi:hypothetical protein
MLGAMTRRSGVEVPEGWKVEQRWRTGPFVTRERYLLPDGSHVTWASRRHRKLPRPGKRLVGSQWWQPREVGWWMAVLFMAGSFLFALGSVPFYMQRVDDRIVSLTLFIGSLFFTSAGYLQFFQVINAPTMADRSDGPGGRRRRYLAWQPGRIDWLSASVQSVGTLLFNLSTWSALHTAFTVHQQRRLVWAPDMFGSIAFMIASTLAWIEVCGRWWRWDPRDVSWRIVALNLGGSIAFQISAFAAFIRPATGELWSVPIANLGTFVGAAGFFFAARLLIPEMAISDETAG